MEYSLKNVWIVGWKTSDGIEIHSVHLTTESARRAMAKEGNLVMVQYRITDPESPEGELM